MATATLSTRVRLGGASLVLVYDRSTPPDGGAGHTVVFLHGITSSRRIWEPILAAAPPGEERLALDLPGFGDSDLPRRRQDLEDFVAALCAFLDALGVRAATLIGHSFGGMVAALFALAAPERVQRLVLVAPAGFTAPVGALTPLPFPWLNRLFVRHLIRHRGGRPLLEGVGLRPEAVTPAWQERLRHGLLRAREAFRLPAFYETPPLGPRLAAAGREAAYVLGGRDPLFPLGRLLPALGPGPLLLLPQEGHVPMVGDEAGFALALRHALTVSPS